MPKATDVTDLVARREDWERELGAKLSALLAYTRPNEYEEGELQLFVNGEVLPAGGDELQTEGELQVAIKAYDSKERLLAVTRDFCAPGRRLSFPFAEVVDLPFPDLTRIEVTLELETGYVDFDSDMDADDDDYDYDATSDDDEAYDPDDYDDVEDFDDDELATESAAK